MWSTSCRDFSSYLLLALLTGSDPRTYFGRSRESSLLTLGKSNSCSLFVNKLTEKSRAKGCNKKNSIQIALA